MFLLISTQAAQGVLLIVGTVGMKILIAKLINVADDVRTDNSIPTHTV